MNTVPDIIGGCGVIHKKFEKLISKKLDIKVNTKEIVQTIVLLGTKYNCGYIFSTNL